MNHFCDASWRPVLFCSGALPRQDQATGLMKEMLFMRNMRGPKKIKIYRGDDYA
jgi:hypothetical protein